MTPASDESNDGSYVSESMFVELLASKGKAKMLDVFLSKHRDELTAEQVAELAGISRSTFDRNVQTFVDLGVVTESRKIGKTQLYRLNTNHPVSKALGNLHTELLNHVETLHRESGDKRAEESPRSNSESESGVNRSLER